MTRSGTLATALALALAAGGGCDGDGPPAEGSAGARPAGRVLVVGWDGASFDLVDPLLAAGRLPNLAALVAHGTSCTLESTVVPISSAAWTAATTGANPGRSGVYSFFETVPGSYDVQLVSSRSNRATPIWRTLTRHGLASVVWGVPVTYPPEPILGVLVAGMLSPQDGAYTQPPALANELREQGFVPDLGTWRDLQPVPTAERVVTQLALKQRALGDALATTDWSLAWIVYKNLDVLSHGLYDGRLDGPIAELLERLDTALGELVSAAGDDVDVLVVSDHGFRAYPRYFNALAWLVEAGFCAVDDDAVLSEPDAGPIAERRAARHRELVAFLDLPRTRVLPAKAEGCFGGLRIHAAGREPEGIVPLAERDALLAELEFELRALRTADGKPLIVRTWRASELYPGPYADALPDLLFEVDPRHVVFSNRPGNAIVGDLPRPYPDHAREGILIAAGPRIAPSERRAQAMAIADLTPTVLALFGLPTYAGLDGGVRVELLRDVAVPAAIPEADGPADAPRTLHWLEASESFEEAEADEIRERMSELGYAE